MLEDLKELCPSSKILPPLVIRGSGGRDVRDKIMKWLKDIKLAT